MKTRLYSFPAYQKRILKSFFNLRGRRASCYFSYKFNSVYREAYMHASYYDKIKHLRADR